MRISGGTARGILLVVPKGDAVRPATDGLRQAVFSSIASRVPGAVFLDLFAGSGAYGLEALSRGAVRGVFVEKNRKAIACLEQNLTAVCKSLGRAQDGVTLLNGDVLEWTLPMVDEAPDLVFIDPPYEMIEGVAQRIFERLSVLLLEKADPVVVFEMPGETTVAAEGWTCVKRLGGGGARQPSVCFFRANRALT